MTPADPLATSARFRALVARVDEKIARGVMPEPRGRVDSRYEVNDLRYQHPVPGARFRPTSTPSSRSLRGWKGRRKIARLKAAS